MTMMMHHF